MTNPRQGSALAAMALAAMLTTAAARAADPIDPADAASHVGEEATVCGDVTGTKFSDHRKRQPTFIDFGPPHPNQLFTALIWGEHRGNFDYDLLTLLGRTICVSGTITAFKGKPEIKVSEPAQIRVLEN